ncbi:hypothetical protein GL2_11970 [Microbulbifer sp. GL-2]|nr:hypothetical protein GL2_11970 [Microbulbifer sp. GL-2]
MDDIRPKLSAKPEPFIDILSLHILKWVYRTWYLRSQPLDENNAATANKVATQIPQRIFQKREASPFSVGSSLK